MLREVRLDQVVQSLFKAVCLLQDVTGIRKRLGRNGVQDDIRFRDGITGSDHPEFKLVARKGKGGRPVPVRGILVQLRQSAGCAQPLAFLAAGRRSGADKLLHDILQLFSQKDGYNGRRRLIGSQTVVIARIGSRFPQQAGMFIHGLDYAGKHQQKLHIFMRRHTRIQQIDPVVGGKRPVVMLSGAVHAVKRLFVQETFESMLARDPLQRLHHQLVAVDSQIRFFIDTGQLMLSRSHFVVLGLGRNPHPPQLPVDILHKGNDLLPDRSVIMVVHLLPLGRHGPEESPSRVDQIFPLHEFFGIHQEVFLLRSDIWRHLAGGRVAEQPYQPQRLSVNGFHGTQKRRLLIQRLAGVGTEGRRNAQHGAAVILADKRGRGAVPGRIAPGLKGGPQSSGGKRRGIGFSFDQFFSGKAHQNLAAGKGRRDKRIMLLRRHSRQRLKPVRIVSGPFLDRPFLHFMRNHIRCGQIKVTALTDDGFQFRVNFFRQSFLHDGIIEHILAENLCNIDVITHVMVPL